MTLSPSAINCTRVLQNGHVKTFDPALLLKAPVVLQRLVVDVKGALLTPARNLSPPNEQGSLSHHFPLSEVEPTCVVGTALSMFLSCGRRTSFLHTMPNVRDLDPWRASPLCGVVVD